MAQDENNTYEALIKRIDALEKGHADQAKKITALEKVNKDQTAAIEALSAQLSDTAISGNALPPDLAEHAAIVLDKYFANERPTPKADNAEHQLIV